MEPTELFEQLKDKKLWVVYWLDPETRMIGGMVLVSERWKVFVVKKGFEIMHGATVTGYAQVQLDQLPEQINEMLKLVKG